MSELGSLERVEKQRWAAPGSRHDKTVRAAKWALPAALIALVLVLAIAPLSQTGDISFILDKNKVAKAPQRMRADAAEYRGIDDEGRPFSLTARQAAQKSAADPLIRMNGLAARMGLSEGTASLTAERGRYDIDAEKVAVDGPLNFETADGYSLQTRDVSVDMKSQSLASAGRVEGRIPIGTFSADKLEADLDERTVVLNGRARLKITQGRAK